MAEKRTYNKGTKKPSTKPTSKKTSSVRASAKQVEEGTDFKDEIALLVLILVSILMLLSIFGAGGKVGGWVSGFLFGLFGLSTYIFPIFLFFTASLYRFNASNAPVKRRVVSSVFLYLCLISLVELVAGHENVTKVLDYYKLSSETKRGGGLMGGWISHAIRYLFGDAGAFAILIILSMIFFVLITGKLLLSILREKTTEHIGNRRREMAEEDEDSDAPIPESGGKKRRIQTVTLAGKGTKKNSSDMTEITVDGARKSGDEENGRLLDEPMEGMGVGEFPDASTINGSPGENETDEGHTDLDGEERRRNEIENLRIERPKEQEPPTHGGEGTPPYEGEGRPDTGMEKDATEAAGVGVGRTMANPKRAESDGGANGDDDIAAMLSDAEAEVIPYQFPTPGLLASPRRSKKGMSDKELRDTAYKIQSTLESFGVRVKMSNVSCGPSVTRYEVQPEQGVKISKITSLSDDIKLNLAAADIRIEAPIPGKSAVGIEVPNSDNATVYFREIIESEEFKQHKSKLAFAVGKDIGGNVVISDISKMPHLLIAGATGSGKSVCINTIIMSLLYKADPNDVKLIMIDPKVVELNVYNGIPHLLTPVVTDPKKASSALNWAVVEMTNRYKHFADLGVRDLGGYNRKVEKPPKGEDYQGLTKMPQIVIIVDELSDLMMVAPGEVEDAICRLAQMARAAGIHLILATQRPSVNVITGLIKANVPSRIAFAVSSSIDSRTILDGSGAEKLLGKGDMLFFPSGYPKPVRIQGDFISDREVGRVVDFIKAQYEGPVYDEEVAEEITNVDAGGQTESAMAAEGNDPYFEEVGRFIIEKDKASIGLLQRVFRIGFNRAARIMDQLCEAGVVGPEEGTKPRKVLMTVEAFEQKLGERP